MNHVSFCLLILMVLLSVIFMFSDGGVLTKYHVVLENSLPEQKSFRYGYEDLNAEDGMVTGIISHSENLTVDIEIEDDIDPHFKITVFWFKTEIENDYRIKYGFFEYLNKDSMPICHRNEKHCRWHVVAYGVGLLDEHKGTYGIENKWKEGTLGDLTRLQH